MKLLNYVQHPVNVVKNGNTVVIESSGFAKVNEQRQFIETVDFDGIGEIDLVRNNTDNVVGLPDPVEGVMYIVSGIVLKNTLRTDVIAPGTGPNNSAIRNEKGHIVGIVELVVA